MSSSHSAPVIVRDLMTVSRKLVEAGQTMVLVEQNMPAALALAERAYIINNGHIVHEAPAREISSNPRDPAPPSRAVVARTRLSMQQQRGQALLRADYDDDRRLGAVRSRFLATRRAAASAACAQVTSSSGSSNKRSGARQNERSIMPPCFS